MSQKKNIKKITKFQAFERKEDKQGGHFRVAIFGSSRVENNDAIYKQVVNLARMLGEKGIDVVTGGGPGLMRAASEGHKIGTRKSGSNAHSIGIGVKLPWNQKFNDAVDYKEKFNRFSKRLDEFMLLSNAVIVTPGGLGTMLELFYTWQLIQVHEIHDMPIILMGEEWVGLLKWIKNGPLKKNYLDKKDYKLVFPVKNERQAMKIIEGNKKNINL